MICIVIRTYDTYADLTFEFLSAVSYVLVYDKFQVLCVKKLSSVFMFFVLR